MSKYRPGDLAYVMSSVGAITGRLPTRSIWGLAPVGEAGTVPVMQGTMCIIVSIVRPKKTSGDWFYIVAGNAIGWVPDWCLSRRGAGPDQHQEHVMGGANHP